MPGSITPTLETLFQSALAFCASGQKLQARRLFRAILDEAPWHVASAANLAALEAEAGEIETARGTILDLLRRHPAVGYRFGSTAHAVVNLRAFDAARDVALMALASAPDDASAWFALAEALAHARLWHGAEQGFRRALTVIPEDPLTAHAFSLMLLALGRSEEGFRLHKAVRHLDFARSVLPREAQYWEGEPLEGKTLFLLARLGLGDTIQYARYVPELTRRAARLTIQVQPALARLLGADPLGPLPDHDVCTAFDELPRLLPPQAPAPYVSVSAEDARTWRDLVRQDARRVVGLVYAGNPRQLKHARRSIDPPLLAPLFNLPDIRFVSFQVEGRADLGIEDLGPRFGDFYDTACALANVDLLISVDTGVAHLAGAMGRADWILLPYDADWRWGLSGERTDWYPSLRLIRQGSDRDWRPVIARLCAELSR